MDRLIRACGVGVRVLCPPGVAFAGVVTPCVTLLQWHELSVLHASACRYGEAQFCLEECVLAAPFNPRYHTELGEALLTAGNAADARKSFALAVKLTEGHSTRALLGLALATPPAGDKDFRAQQLHSVATGTLKGRCPPELYALLAPSLG